MKYMMCLERMAFFGGLYDIVTLQMPTHTIAGFSGFPISAAENNTG